MDTINTITVLTGCRRPQSLEGNHQSKDGGQRSNIPSISALTYEERLKRTGLISLENRRLRADLLEVFKILKGFVKVDPATHFSMSDRRSRGHTLKLEKPRARLELRRHFFSNRVIDAWNSLPGYMVEATSTNMFKAALQRLPHGAFTSWRQLPAPRGHLTT